MCIEKYPDRKRLRPENMMANVWVTVFVSLTMTAMRLSIRLTHGRKSLCLSDWFVVAAAFAALLYGSLSTWFLYFYFKSDETPSKKPAFGLRLNEEDMKTCMKVSMCTLLNYYLVLWLLKGSFVVQYLVLRRHMTKTLRWVVIFSAYFVAATFVTAILSTLLWCQPISVAWEISDRCWIQCKGTLLVFFCCHLSSILILLLIPIVLSTQMQLSRRDISGLIFIIVVVIATICVAIVRFAYLWDFIKSGWDARFGLYSHMLACIEQTTSITATCLPALRILWLSKTEYNRRKNGTRGSSASSEHAVSPTNTVCDVECAFAVTEVEDIDIFPARTDDRGQRYDEDFATGTIGNSRVT